MKYESFEKARDILIKLKVLDEEITELKRMKEHDTTSWTMEIRESKSCSLNEINHCGMLPKFLEAILAKYIAERNKLQKEFDEL